MPPNRRRLLFLIFTSLTALEAAGALALLLSIPADPKNQFLFGLSLTRLMIAAFLAGAALLFAGATWLGAARPTAIDRWTAGLSKLNRRNRLLSWLTGAAGLVLWLLVWTPAYRFGRGVYMVERLQPVLIWLVALALQGFVLLALLRFGWNPKEVSRRQPFLASLWRSTLPLFAALLALAALIAVTGFGIRPDVSYWGGVGAPVLAWQPVVALAASGLAAILLRRRPARQPMLDLVVFLAIWGLSAALWGSQVIGRNYFAPDPLPPNFEYYPYSDAQYYDRAAQSILIGEGFAFHTDVTRPLYILLVAGLRATVGQDYLAVIRVQSLLLACFPAVLYLLGKALHSRPLGIALAVLAALREWNALLATPHLEVVNSQMLMSDFPTALGVAVVVYMAVRWLQNRDRPGAYPLLFGGSLALASLLRFNAVLLLPVVLLFWWGFALPRWKHAFLHTGWAVLGLALVFIPWIWRNYQVTGQIGLEGNKLQNVFEERLRDTPPDEILPTPKVEARRVELSVPGLEIPPGLRFVPQHFLHSQVTSLLIFPTTLVNHSLDRLIPAGTYFHESWQGEMAPGVFPFLVFNLFLLAAGFAYAWRIWRWIGLLPLAAAETYMLSNALARVSGWRYNLPADWVFLVYYAMGLFALAAWFYSAVRPETWLLEPQSDTLRAGSQTSVKRKRAVAALGFLAVGGLMLAAEFAVPQRYAHRSSQEIAADILRLQAVRQDAAFEADLRRFLNQPGSAAIEGVALYPEFYAPGMGHSGQAPKWASNEHDDFRLGLLSIERWYTGIMMPLKHEPDYLPQGSEIYVVGCRDGELMDAYALFVLDERGQVYVRSEEAPIECSTSG